MPQLLQLDSSADLVNSTSRALTARFADTWRDLGPEHTVVVRDLHADPLPHLPTSALHWAPRLRTASETAPPEAEGLQHKLIDELTSAAVVVVGAPMYNWAVPSTLKAWIDYVHVLGLTAPIDGPTRPFAGKPIVSCPAAATRMRRARRRRAPTTSYRRCVRCSTRRWAWTSRSSPPNSPSPTVSRSLAPLAEQGRASLPPPTGRRRSRPQPRRSAPVSGYGAHVYLPSLRSPRVDFPSLRSPRVDFPSLRSPRHTRVNHSRLSAARKAIPAPTVYVYAIRRVFFKGCRVWLQVVPIVASDWPRGGPSPSAAAPNAQPQHELSSGGHKMSIDSGAGISVDIKAAMIRTRREIAASGSVTEVISDQCRKAFRKITDKELKAAAKKRMGLEPNDAFVSRRLRGRRGQDLWLATGARRRAGHRRRDPSVLTSEPTIVMTRNN